MRGVLRTLALGLCLIGAVRVGAAQSQPAASPTHGGTLRVGFVDDTRTLDPVHSITWSERQILFLLYNSLIQIGPDFSLRPGLATSWSFENGNKRVILHLRHGVKFQDGTNFDADAVKWNLEWRMQPNTDSPERNRLTVIKSIDVVDPYTVALNLKSPFSPLLATLTGRAGLMVSPTAVRKYGRDFGSHPVGTGPFVLKQWVRGNHIMLDRNPGFWQSGQPYLDHISFNDIPSAAIGIQRLVTGELDLIPDLTPQDTRLLQRNRQIKLVRLPFGRWFALQCHVNQPPFNNLKLRQAIAHAIDRKQINTILWSGRGAIANSEAPPGLWWSPPASDIDAYNPALAKKLLAESGVAPGTELTLAAPSDNTLRLLAQLVQENIEAIGLRVRLEPIAQSDWYARVMDQSINFTPIRWAERADPDGLIQFLFDSKGAANSTNYRNPEVDQLVAQAEQLADPTQRKPLYDRIHAIVAHDLPYVPLAFSSGYVAMNQKVHGFVPMPDLIPRYRGLWKAP